MIASDRLRAYLGERIPAGGADTDTMFVADEINDLLTGFQGPFAGSAEGLYLAAAEGWERKASMYSDMTDHEQGGAKDTMSSLAGNARTEATRYRNLAYNRQTPSSRRITRPGTQAL